LEKSGKEKEEQEEKTQFGFFLCLASSSWRFGHFAGKLLHHTEANHMPMKLKPLQ
jgi:hypothetical protein